MKTGTDLTTDNERAIKIVSLLNALPTSGLARLPILVTGSWVKNGHEVAFTRDDLRTAVENFHKLANHDLNVDYDHACEDLERAAGEPTPSAGRIVALDEPEPFRDTGHGTRDTGGTESGLVGSRTPDAESRYILYGRYEPTDRARALIKNREYRYVSAAFASDYPDRKTGASQGLTLTSVALTNQPFLDELPEIRLSIQDPKSKIQDKQSGDRVIGRPGEQKGRSPDHPITGSPDPTHRLSAEQGGTSMAKLRLSRAADGTHEAYDGDTKVGEIDHDHLCDYAKAHLADDLKSSLDDGQLSMGTAHRQSAETFARQVGAEGKTLQEIGGLVELALHPPKAEVTLLSEAIRADGGLDNARLDALDDAGRISRSAWRRAKDAEQRVQNALNKGLITPAMLATGAPLRMALSDSAAFKALIEDRSPLIKPNTVVGLGGSGSETGESPRHIFSRLVEEKKRELMSADRRLNELEAHRKAGALIAKENPDLLKNYRSDAKSA